MRKRPNIKHVLGRTMSLLLVASLTAPSTTPLVAYAAEAMNNRPRLVSFERPDALSLDDAGVSDSSDSNDSNSDNSSSDSGSNGSSDSGSSNDSEDSSGGGDNNSGGNDSGGSNTSGGEDSGNGSSGEGESDGSKDTDVTDPAEKPSEGDSANNPTDESKESEPDETDPDVDETNASGGGTGGKPGGLPGELLPEETLPEIERELPDVDRATPSDAERELREPEDFYDIDAAVDEPAGELVQYNEYYRTYQVGDGEYTTIMGGYSGLYEDEYGEICEIDNTLMESNNGASLLSLFDSSTVYENSSGDLKVYFPEKMKRGEGITLEKGDETMELIPSAGNFKYSSVSNNAIRYCDVFENVDVQYTMLGNMVKEDIILLEKTDRNEFSYRLKIPGLKAAEADNSIIIYKSQKTDPLFVINAPIMIDAAGETSTDITLKLVGGEDGRTVRVTADKEWLEDEERAYPVRIDPGQYVPANEFLLCMITQGAPTQHNHWDGPAYAGYIDNNLKNARLYIAFNETDCPTLMSFFQQAGAQVTSASLDLTTMTDNSKGETVFQLLVPQASSAADGWDANRITWKTQPEVMKTDVKQSAPGIGQKLYFDVTDIFNSWISYQTLQVGFAIRAEVEGPNAAGEGIMLAERFYNRDNQEYGPRLTVDWDGQLPDVDLANMALDQSTAKVIPAIIETGAKGRSATGVIIHGVTRAGANVAYTLIGGNGETERSTTAEGEFLYPDFSETGANLPSSYPPIKASNWESDGYPVEELLRDTIYNFEVTFTAFSEDGEDGDGGDTSDESFTYPEDETNSFLIYKVQLHDLAQRIAKHYGVNPNELARDNHLYQNQLTEAGTYLFVRNPGTAEPYTPEPYTDMELYLLLGLLLGEPTDCYFGLEPVNINTGNFYMAQKDMQMEDLGGTFGISRSYNSLIPEGRSEFGRGWSSNFGEKITLLGDGRILFKREDGAYVPFLKDGDIYRAENGRDLILEPMDSLDIDYGTRDDEDLEEAEESPASAGITNATPSNAQRAAAMNTEDEPEEPEAPEEGDEEIPELPSVAGWKMTALDGTVRVFDGMGFIEYKEDIKGHRTTYVYDKEFSLLRVISASGKTMDITMDDEFRITQVIQPDGGTWTYEYDSAGDLVTVTNPAGSERHYEYDDSHGMTAWYDENGNCITKNTYDDQHRVTVQEDANGNTATLEYSDDHTTMTDNNGNVTTIYFDDLGRTLKVVNPDGSTEVSTYNSSGHLGTKKDVLGTTTSYVYDTNGNILTETRGDGSIRSFTYDERNQLLTATDYMGNVSRFSYDEAGNLITRSDGNGNTTMYSYDSLNRPESITDPNSNITRFVYEGNDCVPTSMTDGEGNTSTFSYDEMNRILTSTDAEGNTTSHVYDANGWEISTIAPDGGVIQYDFSPAGEVVSITDAMDAKTDFTYDKMHNILSGTDALGNTLTYTYDGNYNRISETDAKGNVSLLDYDSRDRLIKTTDALSQEVSLELDAAGNILKEKDRRGYVAVREYDKVLGLPVLITNRQGASTQIAYDRNGNVTTVVYADGGKISYTYDQAGRVRTITSPNGLKTEISYDGCGNIVQLKDDDSRVYQYSYDRNNRLTHAEDPLGGITTYSYDGAGNKVSETNAEGHTTSYTYDTVGRLDAVTDALGNVASRSYDLNGNLLKETDKNGHSTDYHYDVLGQLLAQVDATGNVTALEHDALGDVIQMTDALKGETLYEMDALRRTSKVTDAMGGEYIYDMDEEGNVTQITMPDGDTVIMGYDSGGRLRRFRDEAGLLTIYVYDDMDRLVAASDNAGNKMTYEYDISGNLIKQTDTIDREASYEYDHFNRLVRVTGTDGGTTRYGYDVLDRLTSVTQPDGTVTTYEYDKVGNLIKTTEPGEAVYTYAYDAINRLTEKVNPLGAATTFQYDAKGNLTGSVDGEGAATAYAYDAIDRLTQFTDGRGNSTLYEYDELSRLLAYTTPEGSQEEYRYDPLGNLTKRRDANGLITEYQYDVTGNLIKEISPKGAVTSYTYDKHDEVTSITDPVENVTAYEVDLNRQVTRMTAKNGGEYTYGYDAVHRLTDITTPLGLTRTFTYDTADNVVKDTDNLDRTTTYEYDIMHRMTKSINAKGGVSTYTYDIRGNRNGMTDALGYKWNYTYDLVDQLTRSVDPEGKATEVAYNLVGEISSITKPGDRRTSLGCDGNYNRTTLTDPKGYVYEYTYDKDNRQVGFKNPLEETIMAAYDPGSRVTSVTDRMGLTEAYTYDPHGNTLSVKATNGLVTQFSYDILDNLVRVTMPSELTTTYTYDVIGNVTSMTDTMKRTTTYTYDLEGNMTSIHDPSGRTERMGYDIAGRLTSYISNGGNKVSYDYDVLNRLVEKAYEDGDGNAVNEGVVYGYDVLGQRVSMMDRSGDSAYEYDGLGRITKVTAGSGETTLYAYDGCDQLECITYPDGKSVRYEYDKNDNLTKVTDRTGAVTIYVYDAINRVTEIHRPNGVDTYNTYNARDQIVSMVNRCDECGWIVSQYDYTYDDRGFIVAEDATESLYAYAWDDKHDGKHENWHDDLFPHGDKHINKHDKDGIYNFQIIETKRAFTYDDDGKLLIATENEDRQGRYDYVFKYDDMGNRIFYSKARNGSVQESAEYIYNASNQMVKVREYDGKHYKNVEYTYDADGNRILEEEVKPDGNRKVEKIYEYSVENRLKAVSDAHDLLVAMAYDGDGNRIFQLNYNLHTDDDWKGNSGNGNGNNKDNTGSGNNGNGNGNKKGAVAAIADFFTGEEPEAGKLGTSVSQALVGHLFSEEMLGGLAEGIGIQEETATAQEEEETGGSDVDSTDSGQAMTASPSNASPGTATPSNAAAYARKNDNGNNGNGGNGNHYGWGNGNNGNGTNGNGNTSTGGTNDNKGNASGNTNNTGGSQNQSGILFPVDGEVSELEQELTDMIKTTGKQKDYELVEYVNDVNREHVEVLMELNINGIMDTAYSYGNERLTNERFTGWTGYYTYDPRGSVTGVTGRDGYIWQSYRYNAFGDIMFGKPQYNNVYGYNAESFNPNMDAQYLRARYYSVKTAGFISEDSYLGEIPDPLSLNRYIYVKSSPLNYIDPSGHMDEVQLNVYLDMYYNDSVTEEDLSRLVLGANIGNLYLGFHEIAQIHAGTSVRNNGIPIKQGQIPERQQNKVTLESKLKVSDLNKGRAKQGCFEVDIIATVAPYKNDLVWEVKPLRDVLVNGLFNRDQRKFNRMIQYGGSKNNVTVITGDNNLIMDETSIPIIDEYYMGIIAPKSVPGFVYYYFYKDKKDDDDDDAMAEEIIDAVSNVAMKEYLKKNLSGKQLVESSEVEKEAARHVAVSQDILQFIGNTGLKGISGGFSNELDNPKTQKGGEVIIPDFGGGKGLGNAA